MTKLRKRFATVALSAVAVVTTAGGLGGLGTVMADAAEAEVAPIAKYEFKDASNFGKDTMGNYDMSYRNAWLQGGTGPLMDKGTLIDGGGVQFSGEFCVAQDQDNSSFSDVTAFTLAFDLKTAAYQDWQHYLGVGDGTTNYFAVVGRGGNPGSTEASQAAFNAYGTGNGAYWDSAFLTDCTAWGKAETDFQKVIITAQPGGELKMYINGTEFVKEGKLPATLAEGWSPYDANVTFSIGARFNGAADRPSVGAVKNVVFYDFAMSTDEMTEYNETGKIMREVEEEPSEEDLQELLPVAKYEFEDASNPGKDTMGNYDLGLVAKEGGDIGNPWNTGTIEDGVLYLDGTDMLACTALNDVGDNLNNGFTLNFQYRQDGTQPGAWATPVGFGFNDWNVTVVCSFRVEGGYTHLRVAGHGGVAEGDGNTFYGPVVVQDGTDKMHNVTLSVRPGEKFNVYADGALAYSTDCPAGWNVSNSNMAFSIGGECVWGNGYNPFKGWVDNVSIYNFALTLDQSNAYWEKGKLTVGDMDGEIITSISNQPKFANDEVTNGKLTDQLTDTQAVRRVNDATVDALFDNGESVTLPVTWQGLAQEDGKWYIVGVVDTSDLGYASLLSGLQEVKQEVTVERVARTVTILDTIKNGSISADKTQAYLGDTVTFTATPESGYEINTLTVNGTPLTANSDGTFTYTVEGIENIEVNATFKTATGGGTTQPGGDTTQPGTTDGQSNTLAIVLGVVGGVIVIAAIVVAVVVVKKKKNQQK